MGVAIAVLALFLDATKVVARYPPLPLSGVVDYCSGKLK